MLARLVADIEVYRELPDEELDSDITAAIARGIRLFLDMLATGAAPTATTSRPWASRPCGEPRSGFRWRRCSART